MEHKLPLAHPTKPMFSVSSANCIVFVTIQKKPEMSPLKTAVKGYILIFQKWIDMRGYQEHLMK